MGINEHNVIFVLFYPKNYITQTFIYDNYQPNYTPIKGYVLEGCKHRLWIVGLIYKLYLASAAVAQ